MSRYTSVSELLELLAPAGQVETPDWDDVLARTVVLGPAETANGAGVHPSVAAAAPTPAPRRRSLRRRSGLLALGLAALVLVTVAAAYALGHPIVDFGKATRGPQKIVDDFGSLQVGAPAGMAPGVLPHQARRVDAVRVDGKLHILWVAPTRAGGFCSLWSGAFGGCRTSRSDDAARHIDVTEMGTRDNRGVSLLGGSFFQRGGERLEVSFADDTSAEVPFVWVTAPIDAGFYLYRVPDTHRVSATRPTSLALYDGSGKLIVREPVRDLAGNVARMVPQRLPGYPPIPVPANARWPQRRQLFALRADDGTRIGLWVAPARGGGTCFWTNQANACTDPAHPMRGTTPVLALGFTAGGRHVVLCCRVGTRAARVVARFQDGGRADLTPKDGYLIWPIPSTHFPLGHRLDLLVAYDRAGRVIATQKVDVSTRAMYPCAKPKDYGYGVKMCP